MKKYIFAFSILGIFLIGFSCLPSLKNEQKQKEAIGYFKQHFDRKKDPKTGKIEMGLRTKWYKYDQQMASTRVDRRESNPIELVEELGPTTVGGRTRAILIDRADENRIFAGAVSGGMWYSADKGQNWKALNDASSTLSVTCITQSPFETDVIYYGTGEARGITYGEIGEGIFKSTDGGVTFNQIPSTLNDTFEKVWSVQHSLTDTNTMYVGTHDKGAYKTTDAGLTWIKLTAGNTSVTDIEVFSDGSVILAYRGSGLYRSADGAPNTFTKITTALASASGRVEIAKRETKEEVVYAAMEKYNEAIFNMYKSTDSGKTWTALASYPNIGKIQQIYCFALGVHPSNSDYVFVAGVNSAYTKNGGTSWSFTKTSHSDHHVFAFFRGDHNEFLNGNDGGVYLYKWNSIGSSVVDLNDGYNTVQFYGGNCAPTGKHVLGGTQDNGSHRIVDGVHRKMYGADGAMSHISYQNPDLAYIETQYGGLRRSTNYTLASPKFYDINNAITDDLPFVTNYEMNIADGTQLYLLSKRGMWRTIDSGRSWTNVAKVTPSSFPMAVSEEANPTLFWGGSAGRLYRMNKAATANVDDYYDFRLSNPAYIRGQTMGAIAIHPKDPDVIFIGMTSNGDYDKLYRASNALGDTLNYISISGDLPPGLPINDIAIDHTDPDRVWFVATDFGLYHTDNAGENWHKVDEIPNVPIPQIRLRKEDRALFAFTHGRGIWYLKLKENLSSIKEDRIAETNIYPNPASTDVVKVSNTSKIRFVKVYDMTGSVVEDCAFNSTANELDISRLKSGMYFVKCMTDNNNYSVKKLIVN